MSYSSRKRYTSRRERNKKVARNTRLIVLAIFLLSILFVVKNWQSIVDYIKTYTY